MADFLDFFSFPCYNWCPCFLSWLGQNSFSLFYKSWYKSYWVSFFLGNSFPSQVVEVSITPNAIPESLMRWVFHISAVCLTPTSGKRAVAGRSCSELTNNLPHPWKLNDLRVGAIDLKAETQRNQISTWLAAYEVDWHKISAQRRSEND